MFDLRIYNPSTTLVTGPSQSGKTTFIAKLIQNGEKLFKDNRCMQNIIFFYNQWQTLYEDLQSRGVKFYNYLPTKEDIVGMCESFKSMGGSLVIIDDFMADISDDIGHMFTVMSHHYNVTIFLLTQNLFPKNKHFRNISINATYIVIFKNPRDSSQISLFARQYKPGKSHFLLNVYREATKKPYSYIFFDHHQKTPDALRIRSNIMNEDGPVTVWVEK